MIFRTSPGGTHVSFLEGIPLIVLGDSNATDPTKKREPGNSIDWGCADGFFGPKEIVLEEFVGYLWHNWKG